IFGARWLAPRTNVMPRRYSRFVTTMMSSAGSSLYDETLGVDASTIRRPPFGKLGEPNLLFESARLAFAHELHGGDRRDTNSDENMRPHRPAIPREAKHERSDHRPVPQSHVGPFRPGSVAMERRGG